MLKAISSMDPTLGPVWHNKDKFSTRTAEIRFRNVKKFYEHRYSDK